MKKSLIIIFIICFHFLSCSKSSDSPPANTNCNTTKTYSMDVSPIIQSTCAISSGCHAVGSNSGPGALTNFTQVFNARVAIRGSVASGIMPQGGSLSTTQKNAIICWIDSGAPNN